MSDAAPPPAGGTLMQGRRGLIMGVANDRSLAWAIASACAAQGAELAFTYQGDALGKRVRPLAASIGSTIVVPCDVSEDASIDAAFTEIGKSWDRIDFLVHAIGWADKAYLRGKYLDTPREAFRVAMDISCFSFTAVAQRAVPLMTNGGALLTLTYLGAERVMPHYNVMGVAKAALESSVRYLAADLGAQNIRVNAISAGPIKTLAASGIGDFRYILKLERVQRAAGPQHDHDRRRRRRALPRQTLVVRRHGRGPPRRQRLPRRRHEEPGRPRHQRGHR